MAKSTLRPPKRKAPDGWVPDLHHMLIDGVRLVELKDITLHRLHYLMPKKDLTRIQRSNIDILKKGVLDVRDFLEPDDLERVIDLSIETLVVTPTLVTADTVPQIMRTVLDGKWRAGVVTAGSTNGYDLIVSDALMTQHKASFDILFESYEFGVLDAVYLGCMMTPGVAGEYPGERSPIYDFETKAFLEWSKGRFKKGYTASLPVPVGPSSCRWIEWVCFPVIAPHLLPWEDRPLLPLDDAALSEMKLQKAHQLEVTVAHPQIECHFKADHCSPISHAYNWLVWMPNFMAVSRALQQQQRKQLGLEHEEQLEDDDARQLTKEAAARREAAWQAMEAANQEAGNPEADTQQAGNPEADTQQAGNPEADEE